jgi:hypothetical protein
VSAAPRRRGAPARPAPWRERLNVVVFGVDTAGGKAFDVAVLLFIVLSVVAVLLETSSPAPSCTSSRASGAASTASRAACTGRR